jgi:hypothetical protein
MPSSCRADAQVLRLERIFTQPTPNATAARRTVEEELDNDGIGIGVAPLRLACSHRLKPK